MVDTTTAVERKPHTLDEVMIAMDVVDTLRHREDLVRRELDEVGRESELIARLREIYREQGIEVPDRVLQQGVDALKQSRFVYTPPPPSWKRTLLELWARRGTVGKRILQSIVIALIVLGLAYFAVIRPAQEARRQALIEATETLPRSIRVVSSDVQSMATEESVRDRAVALLADGERAIRDRDLLEMRNINAQLIQLRDDLSAEYTLRIVSGPGQISGIARRPPGWFTSPRYYLIVEPVAPDGRILSLPIRDEVTGETSTVSRFGVRVPRSAYDAVAADKRDGVVDRNTFAQKHRGKLAVEYLMPFEGGTITSW